jgi:hypothetical protein
MDANRTSQNAVLVLAVLHIPVPHHTVSSVNCPLSQSLNHSHCPPNPHHLTNCTTSAHPLPAQFAKFHSDTHSCFSPLTDASLLIDRLISGDGQHLIQILDPLFVSEFTFKDEKLNVVASNILLRGLKDLNFQ